MNAATIGVVLALIAIVRIVDAPPLPTLRNAFLDLLHQVMPRKATDSDVVIVEIDERSLAAIGQWPWPRDVLARLVMRLGAQHPRVIGIDILFPEADRSSPEAATLPTPRTPTRNDRALAEALRATTSVLAATVVTRESGLGGVSPPPARIELDLETTASIGLTPYSGVLRSLESLDAASGRVGVAAMPVTRDGVVRHLPAVMLAGESLWPSFGLEILRAALGAPAINVAAAHAVTALRIGARHVDVDGAGNVWLRFAPRDILARISAVEALEPTTDLSGLRGRVVLLGVSATALSNRFIAPGGIVLSSVELNAQFVDNLLSGTYLRRPHGMIAVEIGLAMLGCLALLAIRPQRRGTRARVVCAAIGALIVIASALAFAQIATLIDASYALICMAVVYLLLLGRGIVHAHRVRRFSEREREIALALAEASNRSKSSFLANMSHELRTPLNTIIGASEVIRSGVFGPVSPGKYREYADDIHRMGTRLLDVVGRVLELADVEAGKSRLVETRFDVGPALHECLENLNAIERRNAQPRIVIDDDSSLPELRADRGMFKQMVLSLLSNAVRFTNVHGVVRLRGDVSTGGAFRLTVSDTGSGMTADAIAAAFSPFRTTDHLHANDRGGIGVGLPLTKAMIELHGGDIAVESRPGLGTTVTLTFPAVRVRPQGVDAAMIGHARTS